MNNLSHVKGLLAGFMLVFIWSGWIVVSKYGVSNTLTVWDITGIRYVTASLIVLPFLFFNRPVIRKLLSIKVALCSLACGILYLLTSLVGLKVSEASSTGIIVNGSLPIISTAILYFWQKERLHAGKYLGITIIFFANYILIANDATSLESVMWFLLSAFFLAFYSVSMKVWKIDLLVIMFAVPIINCVIYTPIWYFLPSHLSISSLSEIAIQAVYQGIVVSIIALFFMSYCINKLGSVGAATVMALVPIVTALFSFYFLNEHLFIYTWISALLCTIGIYIYASISFSKST